jgi:hypothetical protein
MLAALSWLLIALEICTSAPRGLKFGFPVFATAMPRAGHNKNYSDTLCVSVYPRMTGIPRSVSDPLMHRFHKAKNIKGLCGSAFGENTQTIPQTRHSDGLAVVVIDADMTKRAYLEKKI